jgi:endonuclease/exonuclease/phosphatase family metal-dependent hydrolase
MVGGRVQRLCAILAGIVALLALPGPATGDDGSPADSAVTRATPNVRVLTYNVRSPFTSAADAALSWQSREPAIVRLVLAQGADIVGLQEVRRTQQDAAPEDLVRDLTTRAAGYRVVRPQRYAAVYSGWRSSPKLIFYRAARFGLEASGARRLPNPYDPGEPCFVGASSRSLTWALLQDRRAARATPRTYLVVNTHLTVGKHCWQGRNVQARAIGQTVAMIQRQRGKSFPQVVIGDFNTDPRVAPKRDRAVAMLTDHRGAVQLRSSGPSGSTHLRNWPNPDGVLANRIDYVLLSRSLRAVGAGTDAGHYGLPMTPSDHLGVWATFAPPGR